MVEQATPEFPDEPQATPRWKRILLALGLCGLALFLSLVVGGVCGMILRLILKGLRNDVPDFTGMLIGTTLVSWVLLKLSRRKLSEIGLGGGRDGLVWGLRGLGGGAAVCALLTAGPALFGLANWVPAMKGSVALPAALLFVWVILVAATMEELAMRGFPMQIVASATGFYPAMLLLNLIFMAGHLGNPSSSALGLANTFLAGMVLAMLWYRTKSLWTPIGAHIGWNLMLPALGVNLSGIEERLIPFDLAYAIPDLWSGGEYGTEGGLICTTGLALTLAWLQFGYRGVSNVTAESTENFL